jgi:hypothetical protein
MADEGRIGPGEALGTDDAVDRAREQVRVACEQLLDASLPVVVDDTVAGELPARRWSPSSIHFAIVAG